MFAKLLLGYNLLVVLAIIILGVKSMDSVTSLIFPMLLLPLVYLFWSRILPPARKTPLKPMDLKIKSVSVAEPISPPIEGKVISGHSGISDRDRRLFLKLIGSSGLSIFLMALFTKQAHGAFFGSMPGPGTIALKNSSGTPIDPAEKQPTDGYKIAQVDDTSDPDYAYYGFVDKDGNWYVQRETLTGANTGDYRYFKGITSFDTNWTGRDGLAYAAFDSIF